MRLGFIKGRYQVIALTEDDGMNISKTNLKFIVHWGLPSSLTAYYQQSIEAGKDGSQVRCRIYLQRKVLLEYDHKSDKFLNSVMLNSSNNVQYENALRLKKVLFLLREMVEYCGSTRYITHFFKT